MSFNGELLYSMLKEGEHVEFNVVRDMVSQRLQTMGFKGMGGG